MTRFHLLPQGADPIEVEGPEDGSPINIVEYLTPTDFGVEVELFSYSHAKTVGGETVYFYRPASSFSVAAVL